MKRFKKILVPVDFSKEATVALEWALKLLKGEKSGRLTLLHVVTPMPITPEAGLDIQAVLKAEMGRAQFQLRRWQKKIPSSVKVNVNVEVGDLSSEINSICRRVNIDLVVMTTHGRHGLTRLIHPNVTERVVRTAPCPVLVLHNKAKSK